MFLLSFLLWNFSLSQLIYVMAGQSSQHPLQNVGRNQQILGRIGLPRQMLVWATLSQHHFFRISGYSLRNHVSQVLYRALEESIALAWSQHPWDVQIQPLTIPDVLRKMKKIRLHHQDKVGNRLGITHLCMILLAVGTLPLRLWGRKACKHTDRNQDFQWKNAVFFLSSSSSSTCQKMSVNPERWTSGYPPMPPGCLLFSA